MRATAKPRGRTSNSKLDHHLRQFSYYCYCLPRSSLFGSVFEVAASIAAGKVLGHSEPTKFGLGIEVG